MDRRNVVDLAGDMASSHDTPTTPTAPIARPVFDDVWRAVTRRSFCTLATVSSAGRPHVAGVLYAVADGALYVSTSRSSRKARNIAVEPAVHVHVAVRRGPVGPPSSVQFAATAELLAVDDPEVRRLVSAGGLSAITGHGELELDDGCIVRIRPGVTLHTYGLGLSLRQLIRNPLTAQGSVRRTG